MGVGTDVYADALGRVRIRFPWQWLAKEPMAKWSSDRSTCWVRVSQGWAGANFGCQFLPRLGEEVIVQFLGGDPDQPIVVGRVYNADHSHTNLAFPAGQGEKPQTFELSDWLKPSPRGDFRFEGIKTRSRDESTPNRYHLLRFDDTCNDEQLLVRSQGRMDVTAKSSRYETTEGNRHVLVEAGEKAPGGSSFITVGGEYDLHVHESRYEAVDGEYQLNVKGDTQIHVAGDCKAVVDGNLSLNATTIVIEASEKITLRVGGSTIVLNPSAVWHDGPFVKKQSGGPADTAAPVAIKDVADATKADPGEPANSRTSPKGGGGVSRGQQTYGPHEADGWTADYSGMVSTALHGLSTPSGDADVE
jgi:type VI secretion system secreted protein VgrG